MWSATIHHGDQTEPCATIGCRYRIWLLNAIEWRKSERHISSQHSCLYSHKTESYGVCMDYGQAEVAKTAAQCILHCKAHEARKRLVYEG